MADDLPEGGRTGNSMGRIYDVFHNRITDLRNQAKAAYMSFQGSQQRKWQIPSDFEGSTLDIASLHEPSFDRQEINDGYEAATKDPNAAGVGGDLISMKLQLDYNACEERAFRARHMTLCRAMCIANGRRYGQANGNLFGTSNGIEDVMAAFLAAGGAAPPEGVPDETTGSAGGLA